MDSPQTGAVQLQRDIDKISLWAEKWLVKFNPNKSESMVISRKRNKPIHPSLYMFDIAIPIVESHKHLGIFFSDGGNWHSYINYIIGKAWSRVNIMKRLRYQLDRRSLEVTYLSFIRPILEYADVVWSNCTQYDKDELDKIQTECARIVTGCTRLVSLRLLKIESGWEDLSSRREKHKLLLFFKMKNGLAPDYLSDLVPQTVGQASSRLLRNSSHISSIRTNTSLYMNSFLPSTISAWNNLPGEVKLIDSVSGFKTYLKSDVPKTNDLFYYGKRRLQVLHTRLRNECSSLNHHLFVRNIVPSPLCSCGIQETSYHFLLICPLYTDQRRIMLSSVEELTEVTLHNLLYGDETLSEDQNKIMFDAVHLFIQLSKRFD